MPTLDWLNRDAAFRQLDQVPYRLLELVSEHRSANQSQQFDEKPGDIGPIGRNTLKSKNAKKALQAPLNWENTAEADRKNDAVTPSIALADPPHPPHDNLLIQGDNLEALKALLPLYRGQVKCIFIDPPYNTKSAFEHYDDNLEHAQWLSMMLPRLQLLRELLREDGSIWVTIDDNEGHYLKVLMDEVFGRGNFVANVIWQKVYSVRMDSTAFSADHDHLFVYSRSSAFQTIRLTVEQDLKQFSNVDSETGRKYRKRSLRKEGSNSRRVDRPNLWYSIPGPDGVDIWPVKPDGTEGYWRWSPRTLEENREFLEFAKSARGWEIYVKQFAETDAKRPPSTVWPNEDVGHNHEAKEEVKSLTPTDVFATPKPERLLARVMYIATNPNDLILDSFLGSGTTAAVAQKMNRRWIGIEMGEHAKTHCLPRLQKVIDGEQGGISKAVSWQGGGSFRFMKLGATIFDETGAINPDVRFATLAAFIWMQETKTPWGKLRHGSTSSPRAGKALSPFLGTYLGVDYFLLFNGILGDKRPQAGNVLTSAVLQDLSERFPSEGRSRVIYGEATRLGEIRLANARITFKQLPYDVGTH
jgi:adenine-specific DNA-methyltransferase